MSVVVSMQEVGPCRQQVVIEVPKPAVDAETERVVGSFRKDARLPGFRKGKAPRELVRRRFGSEIRQEVVDRLVPRYWRQAEAEKQLDPLLPPQLEKVEFELGDAMSFTAVVEVRPAIEVGQVDGFDLPSAVTEPAEADVEQELTSLRRRFGTWKEAERAAAQGDLVRVSVQKGEDDPDPLTFEVGEPRVWEELSLAVSGLEAGQKSTFEKAAAEGEEKQTFRVTVEKVEERELPELTDEWVAEATELASVEELRGKISDGLRANLERRARNQRESALMDQLRERHPVALPQGVVEHETESMLRDYAHSLAHQGVDLEKAEIDWGSMAERVRPEAEKKVHGRLVLDAIAGRQEIEVPEEKLEGALAEIASSRGTSALNVRRQLDRDGRLGELRKQLRRQETVAALLGDRDDVESPPSEAEAEA